MSIPHSLAAVNYVYISHIDGHSRRKQFASTGEKKETFHF